MGSFSPADMEQIIKSMEQQFGMDKPLLQQYLDYLWGLLRLDFGYSLQKYPSTVLDLITQSIPWTLGLLAVTTIISFALGTLLGAIAAWPRSPRWMRAVATPFILLTGVPPVLMGDEFYGDGAMREASPFSAAIHLGAQRLLVVGTRDDSHRVNPVTPLSPTFGQIFGYMLDSLFSDGLYSDLERLTQLNGIVDRFGPLSSEGVHVRYIDMLVMLPSRDLSDIARHHVP